MSDSVIEQARQLMEQIEIRVAQQEKKSQQKLSTPYGDGTQHAVGGADEMMATLDASYDWRHAFYAMRRFKRCV